MNASTAEYWLQPQAGLLFHGTAKPGMVAEDALDSADAVQALVASGDCFVTLATIVDEAAEATAPDSHISSQLEKVTATLLYLQRHYEIRRKPAADHRQ